MMSRWVISLFVLLMSPLYSSADESCPPPETLFQGPVETRIRAGEYREAETLARMRLTSAQQIHGTASVQTARALEDYVRAATRMTRGTIPGLIQMADDVVANKRTVFPATHAEVARALLRKGELLTMLANFQQARPVLRDALAIMEFACGTDHPVVVEALMALAAALESPQARPLLERALAIIERSVDPEPVQHITVLFALARADQPRHVMRRLDTRAREMGDRHLPAKHPLRAELLNGIANELSELGQPTEAQRMYRRALQTAMDALGPSHQEVALILSNLGLSYMEISPTDIVRSTELLERSVAMLRETVGPDHTRTGNIESNLASNLIELGQYGRAKTLLEHNLEVMKKTGNPSAVVFGSINLGSLLYHLGDLKGATALLAGC